MAANTVPLPNALTFQIETSDEDTLVRCSGNLTYETAATFKAQVKPLLSDCRRVLLDFSEVSYIDSSGLGALVGVYASAKGAGRDLQLSNVQPRIRDLLRLTNLLPIFGLQ